MKKYDAIIFGNGFNCAVNNELGCESDTKYSYLFSLCAFLHKLYEYEEGKYEDEIISMAEQIWLRTTNTRFMTLCERLKKYYTKEEPIELICNIEPRLVWLMYGFLDNITTDTNEVIWGLSVEVVGKEMEELENNSLLRYISISSKKKIIGEHLKRLDVLLSEIYMLYNVHAIVQNWYIFHNTELEEKRKHFYQTFINTHLKNNAYIMTTNYGEEIENYYPNVEYLHGKFISYKDVLSIDGEVKDKLKIKKTDGCYSFLFGATPTKKHHVVEKGIYDNSLFLDAKGKGAREYGDLLIFGMSFAAIRDGFLYPYITKNSFYENIDMHIIKALNDLFVRKKIHSVTIVAHNEEDSKRYQKFLESFKKSEDVEIDKLYEGGKIKIISSQKFSEERETFWDKIIYKMKRE